MRPCYESWGTIDGRDNMDIFFLKTHLIYSYIISKTFILTHLNNGCWLYTGMEGWSGGAMVLGKLPASRRPTIWMRVGQGPIVLAVGAGGGCLDIFTLLYPFSSLSPSLWKTDRYRLKYYLKGAINPKQPTNYIRVWHQ